MSAEVESYSSVQSEEKEKTLDISYESVPDLLTSGETPLYSTETYVPNLTAHTDTEDTQQPEQSSDSTWSSDSSSGFSLSLSLSVCECVCVLTTTQTQTQR